MTKEEAMELEPGTILDSDWDTVIQTLKRISDGYIVLDYSPNHNVFNVEFKSFDTISEYYNVSDDRWREDTFDGENIKHMDDFGFCKPVE